MVTQPELFVYNPPWPTKTEPTPNLPFPDRPNGFAINLRGAPPKSEKFVDAGVEYKVSKGGALVTMKRPCAGGGHDGANVEWSPRDGTQGAWSYHALRDIGPGCEMVNAYARRVDGVETYTEARAGVMAFWDEPDPPERRLLELV